ncbi:MAG: AI-2E family transporter [Acidobacteriota bacterium]
MNDAPSADQRLQTISLLLLATIAVGFALYWLQSVLVPFVLSLFIALGLSPLISLLTRRLRLPHWLAVLVTLLFGIALMALVGFLITVSANRLAANASNYQSQVRALVNGFLQRFPLEQYGLNADEVVRLPLQAISTVAVSIANAVVSLVSQGSLVLIFLGFLLLGGSAGTSPDDGSASDSPAGGLWGEAESQVKRYIVFKFILSAITGVLVGSILAALRVELAMTFGLMAFLLNFIPSIGSIVATLLPLPVVLVSPEASWMTVILALAVPGVVQISIGNIVEPKLMGGGLDLHPVTVLLALMIWGTLWGIVGMLLATPITAVIKIICERSEVMRPVADLFAGRLDALRGG